MNRTKFSIDIQHTFTDNDNEENEYVVTVSDDILPDVTRKFVDMTDITKWVGSVIRDTLVDYGMY